MNKKPQLTKWSGALRRVSPMSQSKMKKMLLHFALLLYYWHFVIFLCFSVIWSSKVKQSCLFFKVTLTNTWRLSCPREVTLSNIPPLAQHLHCSPTEHSPFFPPSTIQGVGDEPSDEQALTSSWQNLLRSVWFCCRRSDHCRVGQLPAGCSQVRMIRTSTQLAYLCLWKGKVLKLVQDSWVGNWLDQVRCGEPG